MASELETKIITNFNGNLLRQPNGELVSGNSRYLTTNGVNPYTNPQVLSFMESARSIAGAVVTDLVMAAKPFLAAADLFVYAIGNSGRVYKIQVNNISTKNPDYDNPVLLATLLIYTLNSLSGFNVGDNVTSSSGGVGVIKSVNSQYTSITIQITSGTFLSGNTITDTTTSTTHNITGVASPTFHYTGTIEFYSGKIFIGHDAGLMELEFDGTGQAQVGSGWTANCSRPMKQFIGNLYVGNQYNIAEINSSLVATTLNKLSPSVLGSQQIIDLDVTADGVYLVLTAQGIVSNILDSVTPNVFYGYSEDSGLYYWNGSDDGITRFDSLPSCIANSYLTFGNLEYLLSSDILGASLSTPAQKILTLPFLTLPQPNAMSSNGNMVLFMAPEYIGGKQQAALHAYGQLDEEYPQSHYRNLLQPSTLANGDVVRIPSMCVVSNITYGGQTSGYTNNILMNGKIYFSTLEYDGSSTHYGFYAFNLFPTGSGTSINGAVYETQEELFTKKIVAKEIRIYLEPAVTGISFRIDLIGIDGNVLPDSSGLNTFTEGQPTLMAGTTLAWYNPKMNGTPALGIRITNLGTVTPYIHKIEVDPVENGK